MAKGAPYGLSENALRAVEQWKFKPARREGKPVKAMLHLGINFRLSAYCRLAILALGAGHSTGFRAMNRP